MKRSKFFSSATYNVCDFCRTEFAKGNLFSLHLMVFLSMFNATLDLLFAIVVATEAMFRLWFPTAKLSLPLITANQTTRHMIVCQWIYYGCGDTICKGPVSALCKCPGSSLAQHILVVPLLQLVGTKAATSTI